MAGKLCGAKTKSGQPCSTWAVKGSAFCFMHDPASAVARADARRKGGYNRRAAHGGGDLLTLPEQIRDLAGVLALLDYVRAETVYLENSIARGRLLVSLAGEYRAAIVDGDLEQRIQRLEEAQSGRITAAR